MLLKSGDKILVAHRRLYPEDHPRYFIGTVKRCEAGLASVRGNSWVRDPVKGEFGRKSDERTKIVALGSGSVIIYQLPEALQLEQLRFDHGDHYEVWLHDGGSFRMDLSERVV